MQKIKYLEGLRGIAALIVLFSHLHQTCFIIHKQLLYSHIESWNIFFVVKDLIINILNLLHDGDLAVWIFWVLSSYVISILFFKKNENYDKIVIGYFSKRYFRLFIPVFFSIIFAYVLLEYGLMFNHHLATKLGNPYSNGWLSSFYNFKPNFFIAIKTGIYTTFFNYQNDYSYNAVLWTIYYEFLGSLFTFSIFGIIRHNSRRFLLYFIITIILIKLKLLWLCAFVIGHILCDYDFSIIKSNSFKKIKTIENKLHEFRIIVFIFSLLFIIFSTPIMTFLNIPYIYHKLILSIFIVYICLRNKLYKLFFSSRIPFWLGKISFSLYLVHLPILCSFTCYLIYVNNTFQSKILVSLLTIIVVLIISLFFTKYIDKKSVIFANKIGDYFKKYS